MSFRLLLDANVTAKPKCPGARFGGMVVAAFGSRGALVAALVLALVFAGCSGDSGDAKESPSPTGGTGDGGAGEGEEKGVIKGLVMDDESAPIAAARVGILKLNLEIETDELGGFQFLNVPVGTYDLAADRLGYQGAGKKVTVKVGEASNVIFELKKLVIKEPLYYSYPHNALHHVGETYVTWAIGLTGNRVNCDGCAWTLVPPKGPSHGLVEIQGRHTVPNPQGDKEHYWIFNTGNGNGTLIAEAESLLPFRLTFNNETMGQTKNFWSELLCENFWFCVEERREVWITFFYEYDEVPDDFTAFPPAA
jgi:hypothetical protein